MNVKNTLSTPFLMSSNLLNPPEIEKIIDTTLTKDNRRYYKVKWVKVTWESEDDLAYFSDIVDSFWAEYTKECLLQQESSTSTDPHSCQYPPGMNTVSNKEVYSFLIVPPNEIAPPSESCEREENLNPSVLPSSPADAANDLLPLTSHEMLSPSCSVHHEVPSSSDILNSHLNGNDLDSMMTDSCKALTDFDQDYEYSLSDTSSLMRTSSQEVGTTLIESDPVLCNEEIQTCKECGSKFFTKTELKRHHKKCCEDVEYKCCLCNTVYKCKDKYMKHEKSHANRKCPICGKEFQRLGHLKTHMYTHSNIKPYTCNQCDKSFGDKSSLSKHMLVHTAERKFSCTECMMTFKRAQHLRRHVEIHKQIKSFSCPHCDKKFGQKSTLEIHLNTHTGNKPFCCKTCHLSFGDRATLRRHTLTHAEEKPFKCKECNKEFCRLSSLKSHMKSKIHSSTPSCVKGDSEADKNRATQGGN